MNIEQITLVRTPQGAPMLSDFSVEGASLSEPILGQALVRVLALSLDPYLRSVMSSRHLNTAIAPGEVVSGEGLVEVLVSKHRAWPRVRSGWQPAAGEAMLYWTP